MPGVKVTSIASEMADESGNVAAVDDVGTAGTGVRGPEAVDEAKGEEGITCLGGEGGGRCC